MLTSSKIAVKRTDSRVWIASKGRLYEFSAGDEDQDIISRRIRNRKVAVILQERYAITKVLSFPFSERRKIREGIKYELISELPGKIDDYLYKFKVIGNTKSEVRVLVVIVRRDVVDNELDFWMGFGARPVSVTFDFVNAVSRFLSSPLGAASSVLLAGSDYIVGFGKKEIFFHKPYAGSLSVDELRSISELDFGGNKVERSFVLDGVNGCDGVERVGNLLWEFSVDKELNLLKDTGGFFYGGWKVVIFIGVLSVFVVFADQVLWLYNEKKEYNLLKTEIKKEYISTFGEKGIDDLIYNARQRVKALVGNRKGSRFIDVLYTVARAIEGYGVRIENLEWNGKYLRFSAEGKGFASVKLVQERLKEQSLFKDVVIKGARQGVDKKNVRFVIDVVVER